MQGATIVALLVLMLSLAAGSQAFELTEAERGWLEANRGSLTLQYDRKFPPLEFTSSDGRFDGLAAEVIQRIEDRLGIRFTKQAGQDWPSQLEALKHGRTAVIPVIVRTEERSQYAFFSKPYLTIPVGVITQREAIQADSLDGFQGRRVAVVDGYVSEGFLRERYAGRLDIVPVNSVQAGLRDVAFGVVDAMVANLAVAAHYIHEQQLPNLQVAFNTDLRYRLRFAVSREYPKLFQIMQKAYANIPDSELAGLRREWIRLDQPGVLSSGQWKRIKVGLGIAAGMVLALGLIAWLLRRKLRENVASLQQSEEKYRAIFNNSPIGIFRTSYQGRFIDANPTLARMLGYASREDLLASVQDLARDIYPRPQERRRLLQALHESPDGVDMEIEFKQRDGQNLYAVIKASLQHDQHGKPAILNGTIEDITERKLAEEALRQSEERFRLAMEASQDGIWDWNVQTDEVYYSPGYTAMLGFSPAEATAHISFWRERIHPDDLDHVLRMNQECLENRQETFEVECRMQTKDGGWRWILGRGKVVRRDQSGRALRMIGTHTDITERKQAEQDKETLQHQLLQAQKMESIGRLAGGVAHDLNNMLVAILGYGELLLADPELDQGRRDKVAMMQQAGQKSRDLVQQLLAFSRKQPLKMDNLDINHMLRDFDGLLQKTLREDIEISYDLQPRLPAVQGDRGQLEQVILNLAVNAQDAMPEGGSLSFASDVVDLDEAYASRQVGTVPGRYVRLTVSDTGQGIEPEAMERIFEPFFTTKGQGQGTGLGLATAYGIVKQHGGNIWVTSRFGQGAVFTLYLPESPEAEVRPNEPAPAEEAQTEVGGSETILVAEDDPMVRELAEAVLEEQGYRVMAAESGSHGLELLQMHPGTISLLFTDLIMPDMTGKALYERVVEMEPGIKVLYMSGYAENVITHHGVLDEQVAFIQKPFSIHELLATVREVLDGQRP
jgi:PAS domain S-box-containing protein